MRRLILTLTLVVIAAVAIPAVGFLTARNAPPPCGPGSFTFEGSGPAPVSNPAGAAFTVRAATWNVARANTTGGVINGLRRITKAADVIGLQELHPEGRRRVVERRFRQSWGISDGNNAVQILWRRSHYERLGEGSEKVFDVERIEPGVAGTAIGPKSVQWVQLRDKKSGAVFFVANHHIVPSIDRRGRPDRRHPKRLALYKRQMDAMLGVIGQLRRYGPVFTTGDLNVDERRDSQIKNPTFPYARMGAAGLKTNWETVGYPARGTHGRRLIDSVWATTANAKFVKQRILPPSGSDHNPVIATATNRSDSRSVAAASAVGDRQASVVSRSTVRHDTGTPTVGKAAGQSAGNNIAGSNTAAAASSRTGSLPTRLTVPGAGAGSTMTLTGEQVEIAAAIIREGKAAGVPEQGWIVALAAGLQESGLRNLGYGDRDSLGIFQQRPSSGWGTPDEIRNIDLSIRAFYGVADHTHNPGLTDITGWESLSIARAAQAVQISALPDAYAKWEPAARATVDQLRSLVGAANAGSASCDGDQPMNVGDLGTCPPSGLPAEKGLTRDALLVIRCAHEQFPTITSIGGVRPDALPDHPSGRALDLMIPNYKTAEGNAFGWQVAHWMRAHHKELGVEYVIFDAKIWSIRRTTEGWRPYNSITGSINDSSMHRNHVHITVIGDAGQRPQ